jgi:hypothetical protein
MLARASTNAQNTGVSGSIEVILSSRTAAGIAVYADTTSACIRKYMHSVAATLNYCIVLPLVALHQFQLEQLMSYRSTLLYAASVMTDYAQQSISNTIYYTDYKYAIAVL